MRVRVSGRDELECFTEKWFELGLKSGIGGWAEKGDSWCVWISVGPGVGYWEGHGLWVGRKFDECAGLRWAGRMAETGAGPALIALTPSASFLQVHL